MNIFYSSYFSSANKFLLTNFHLTTKEIILNDFKRLENGIQDKFSPKGKVAEHAVPQVTDTLLNRALLTFGFINYYQIHIGFCRSIRFIQDQMKK
jgi:hypothetical protein